MRKTPGGWKRYARPHSAAEPRTVRNRRKAVPVLVLALVLVIGWTWRIRSVEVEGATLIPNAAVRDAALSKLQGRWWGIVPRAGMLTVGLTALEDDLRDQFAFRTVEGRRHLDGRLTVRVSEQPLTGIVRFDGGNALLLGMSGQVLGQLPESLSNAETLMVFEGTGSPPVTGVEFLPITSIAALQSFWRELALAAGSLQPSVIVRRAGSTDEFDVRTAGGAVVTVTAGEQAGYQLTKLQAVLRDRPSAEQRTKLRSIDLRYGDRVYVQ